MRRRVKVRELMQREGLNGEVVNLFPSQSAGIIHGDDGYDVAFNDESLVVGLGYSELSIGQRVSYGIFFAAGARVPVAINVQPAPAGQTEPCEELAPTVLTRKVGSGVARRVVEGVSSGRAPLFLATCVPDAGRAQARGPFLCAGQVA